MKKMVNGVIMDLSDEEIKEIQHMQEVEEPEQFTLEELAKRQERTDEAVQDLILMMMEG